MRSRMALVGLAAALAAASSPSAAQKLGQGGTGVDENSELPRCSEPLGVAAVVEEKKANPMDDLPPGMAALVRMAEAQNGGGTARVDPLPLVKLLAAKSGCFRVVERGAAFAALQAERQIGGQAPTQGLTQSDYLISVQVLYSDAKSRESGGGFGGAFGALGLKSKTLEAQILTSLVDVRSGLQVAVATGSARKKDIGVIGGGLLLNLGVGALGGTYGSTDIGKITSLAMLDAFRKLTLDAKSRIPARAAATAPSLAPAVPAPAIPVPAR